MTESWEHAWELHRGTAYFDSSERNCFRAGFEAARADTAMLTASEIRIILVNLDWEPTRFPPAIACLEKLKALFKAADPEAFALYESASKVSLRSKLG